MDQVEPRPRLRTAVSGVTGAALLLLWLSAMAGGFATLRPQLQPGTPDDLQALGAYLASLPAMPAASSRGKGVAYLRRGCHCPGTPPPDLSTLGTRLRAEGFAVRELPHAAAAPPYPLVVAGHERRLLYAGPMRWGPACGDRDLLPPMLQMLADGSRPPLVVDGNCTCS